MEPKIIFEEYLFYNNLYKGNNAYLINKRLNQQTYYMNNITFLDKCPNILPDEDSVVIIGGSFECKKLSELINPVRITRLLDVYEDYRIYNDELCKNSNLPRYISQSAYQDFEVEKQSVSNFCANWITKL